MQTRTSAWRRAIWNILRIDLVVFVAVGLICLLGGWRTWHEYSLGLVLACGGVIGIGVYSAFGSWMTTGSFQYQYGSTVNRDTIHERAQQAVRDRNAGLRFLIQCVLACLLPLSVGVLIQYAIGGLSLL